MKLCACNCGLPVGKGSTWRRGHHQRVKPNQPLVYRTERDLVLGCLIWRGATTRGSDPIVSHEGKNRLARHVEWEKANGPIPAGHELRSSCKRRKCIEPAHLELRVTPLPVRVQESGPRTHATAL